MEDRSTEMLISVRSGRQGGRTNVSRVQTEIANNKFAFIVGKEETESGRNCRLCHVSQHVYSVSCGFWVTFQFIAMTFFLKK